MKTPPHGSAIGVIVYHERDGLTDTEYADELCCPVLVYLYYYEDSPHASAIGGIVFLPMFCPGLLLPCAITVFHLVCQ